MRMNGIRRLRKAGWLEEAHQAIDEMAQTGRPVNMQVAGTRIAPRPRAHLQQGNEIGNMIGMKMRYHDMVEHIMRNARFEQALHDPMPAIKENGQPIKL